jgi:hypothetical protein
MKRIFTILAPIAIGILLTASVFAQTPEKMSYQAVIRDASDNLITDTQVGMQISILQGSASGTAIYVETQEPTTNANGLVSLEIGTGTTSDDFTTIDWANGPYYIKTETDPTGGTSYSITGTSQLLSVPYALHAKTAESVTGTITETDPIFTSSQAANITATDITNLGNLSGTNTGDQDLSSLATKTALGDSTAQVRSEIPAPADGSETKVTAGTNVTVTGAGTTASPYVVNATGGATLAIGDSYQGGIIFWLDATGQHGLIAATTDQSTGIQWYNGTYTTTNAVRDGIGAGMYNTERIIANQSTGSYAAQLCANYQGGGYGDWYLPSKYELNLLYLQKVAVGGFASAYYWSSTENNSNYAWIQYFDDGYQSIGGSKDFTYYVRAIRAF